MSEINDTYKKQAQELCDITLKLHSTVADVHSMYGDFLFKDKKTKEAQAEYISATKIEKSNFAIWSQLMFIDSELNDYTNLESHSAEAMELFPNNPISHYFNGVASIQLKKYDTAIKSLEDGIEFVYDNKSLLLGYYTSLGNAYNAIKNYTKSDKAYDDALKVNPDDAETLNNYAYFLSLRKEKLEKAEKVSIRDIFQVPAGKRLSLTINNQDIRTLYH